MSAGEGSVMSDRFPSVEEGKKVFASISNNLYLFFYCEDNQIYCPTRGSIFCLDETTSTKSS